MLKVGRLILWFALLPAALLLIGLMRAVGSMMVRLWRPMSSKGATLDEELLALTSVGFVAFVVMYSLWYRDFSTMKAEFLFPGLLAYLFFFAQQTQRAGARLVRWPCLEKTVRVAFTALLILYVTDIVVLAVQLT